MLHTAPTPLSVFGKVNCGCCSVLWWTLHKRVEWACSLNECEHVAPVFSEEQSLSTGLITGLCVRVCVCVCVCQNCLVYVCDKSWAWSVTNPSSICLVKYKVTSPLLKASLQNPRSRSISPYLPPLLPHSLPRWVSLFPTCMCVIKSSIQ